MDHKDNDQSVNSETQSSESENNKEFVPEKDRDEYADKWRKASAEAQKYRKEKAHLKQELEKRENLLLEEQGKYKDMYQKTKDELEGLKGGLKNGMKKTTLKDKLLTMGCNQKMVDKALRHAELDGIETDPENYQPNMEQIEYEAKRIKEEVPVFFGKGFTSPKDGVPGSSSPSQKRDLKTMDDKDLDKAFYEALKP